MKEEYEMKEEYWEKLRDILTDMIVHDTGVEYTDAGVYVSDDQLAKIIVTVDDAITEATIQDHSKCPLPLTCIGYISALEDVSYAIGVKK